MGGGRLGRAKTEEKREERRGEMSCGEERSRGEERRGECT